VGQPTGMGRASAERCGMRGAAEQGGVKGEKGRGSEGTKAHDRTGWGEASDGRAQSNGGGDFYRGGATGLRGETFTGVRTWVCL